MSDELRSGIGNRKPKLPMNALCVIPARYGSRRLPGKPLAQIDGLPLVMWVYNRAVESGAFAHVCVATDDERIRAVVEHHGGRAVMTRPDHASGTDRACEVAQSMRYGYVVNLQGDEPLIPLELLRAFTAVLHELDNNSLLTCVGNATINETQDPNVVKAVCASNGDALYFSRAPIPYARDGAPRGAYRHTGLYGFTREGLVRFCGLPRGTLECIEKLEQLRALEGGMRIRCLTYEYRSEGIDTPEQLERFRRRIKTKAASPDAMTGNDDAK